MAVGRDNWNDLKSDNPIDSIKDTVFFQLVDFCFVQGLVGYLFRVKVICDCVLHNYIYSQTIILIGDV